MNSSSSEINSAETNDTSLLSNKSFESLNTSVSNVNSLSDIAQKRRNGLLILQGDYSLENLNSATRILKTQ